MKPLLHAKSSAKKYGGVWAEYMQFHDWMDQTKANMADSRHRAILHSTFGIYLGEQMFGACYTNSIGKDVSVRDILEDHVIEDLGFIPTMENYLANMTIQPWMSGTLRNKRKQSYEKLGRNSKNCDLIDELYAAEKDHTPT